MLMGHRNTGGKTFLYLLDGLYTSLRAMLSEKAELWRWSSLWVRLQDEAAMKPVLAGWPMARPGDWVERVNRPQDEKELAAIRRSRDRGRPFGDAQWTMQWARQLGLESTLRPVGRPKRRVEKENGNVRG